VLDPILMQAAVGAGAEVRMAAKVTALVRGCDDWRDLLIRAGARGPEALPGDPGGHARRPGGSALRPLDRPALVI
jgi:hypothetical protein